MNNIATYIIEAYKQGYTAGALAVHEGKEDMYDTLDAIVYLITEAEKGTKHE